MPTKQKIIVLGSSGFIGSACLKLIKGYEILSPSQSELDVSIYPKLDLFIKKNKVETIINFVGFVNTAEAEKERSNKNGITWKTNVEAIKNVALACRKYNRFLIHISTDAVFPGTDQFPGPYKEMFLAPQNFAYLSWYGYTKLLGENEITSILKEFAIIRISYPFGDLSLEKDFSKKITNIIINNQPLFRNLKITPTYFPDLAKALKLIIKKRETGIFHIACHKVTSIYQFGVYLQRILKLENKVQGAILKKDVVIPGQIPRTIRGGLLTEKTEKTLNIKLCDWKEALNQLYNFLPNNP